ncbi:MAG: hypothetical protein WBY93_21440 [Candidatus Binatus sp.]
MAIAQVFVYRPRPGGTEKFLADAKRADKILRRLGATARTLATVVGGAMSNGFIYVMETPSWKAHGELSAKVETDSDWRKFMDEVTSTDKPTVDLVSSAVYSEIPLG